MLCKGGKSSMKLLVRDFFLGCLLMVSAPAFGMTVISCDMSGVNKVDYFGKYKSENRPIGAILKLNISEAAGRTWVDKYTIDWTKGKFDHHGILQRPSPSISVNETTILIRETSATNEIENVDLLSYGQRISIDRFSGKVVLDVNLMEKITFFGSGDTFMRDQSAKMAGQCGVYKEQLF